MNPEPLKNKIFCTDKYWTLNDTIETCLIKHKQDVVAPYMTIKNAVAWLKEKLIEEKLVELPEPEKFTKPTHGTCCTCQTCGGDIDHCYCGNHLEIFDLIDEAFGDVISKPEQCNDKMPPKKTYNIKVKIGEATKGELSDSEEKETQE